ncbi:hypothetical protein [Streptomyces sp. NPDC003832]
MAYSPIHRTLACATAVGALLTLSGCGDGDSSSGAADSGGLKVGVLFPGSLSDDGFMESAYRGYRAHRYVDGRETDRALPAAS